jgi:hypothetical protein
VNTSEFLDASELHQLTGAARANAQEAWLKTEGIPYQRRDNRVIVCRVHARAWVEGRPVVSSSGPNWDAARA